MTPITFERAFATPDREARPLGPAEPPLTALDVPLAGGFGWDADDASTELWYPQGICAGPAASDGKRVLAVSWARRGDRATRVSLAALDGTAAARYRHVDLVEPRRGLRGAELAPVRIHAGGIAWHGRHLIVADTLRGLRWFALDDMLEVQPGRAAMPQVGAHYAPRWRSLVGRGARFSFLSATAEGGDPILVTGEYRDKRPGARVVRWRVPADPATGSVEAVAAYETDRTNLQGALEVRGHLFLASSRGRRPGSLAVYRAEEEVPALVRPWATGPEDLAADGELVWSLTERPHDPGGCPGCGRVVFAVRAAELTGAG
jgi:hypothetical protein